MDDDDPLGLEDWPEELDPDDAYASLKAFWSVLQDDSDCEVVITSNLDDEVRAELPEELSIHFARDRGDYGRVAGKTIAREDGTYVVIVDAQAFRRDTPSAESLLRHEAHHVVLHRRQEATVRSYTRLTDKTDLHPEFLAMAGLAVEEFRVQRAVYPDFPDDPWSAFEAMCVASHDRIRTSALKLFFDPFKNIAPVKDTVMAAFTALTTQTAYIAAQLVTEARATPALKDVDLDRRLLGEPWRAVVSSLRALPPADERMSEKPLLASVLDIAAAVDVWLKHAGFSESVRDNATHFGIHEHKAWCLREPLSREQAAV